jgi:hypothetical protein
MCDKERLCSPRRKGRRVYKGDTFERVIKVKQEDVEITQNLKGK